MLFEEKKTNLFKLFQKTVVIKQFNMTFYSVVSCHFLSVGCILSFQLSIIGSTVCIYNLGWHVHWSENYERGFGLFTKLAQWNSQLLLGKRVKQLLNYNHALFCLSVYHILSDDDISRMFKNHPGISCLKINHQEPNIPKEITNTQMRRPKLEARYPATFQLYSTWFH